MKLKVLVALLSLVAVACASSGATSTTAGPDGSATSTTVAPSATTTLVLGPDASLDIVDFSFSPQTITVAVGSTVTWENMDNVPHTTTSDTGLWDSERLQGGTTFSFVFDEAGEYPFHCEIHRTMKGTITVVG